MEIRIEDVCRLAVGGDYEGGEMVGDGRVVRGGIDCIDGGHDYE